MKIFFKDIFLFFVFSLVIIFMMSVISDMRNRQLPYNTQKDKNILIMGDSMTECAINDSIITRSINLSQSARPIIASCNYIQKIVSDNNHIDTVLLAVNASLFSKEQSSNYSIKYIAESVCVGGVFNEKLETYIMEPKLLCYVLTVSFKLSNLKTLITGVPNVIGKYRYLERDKLQEHIERDRSELPYKANIDTTLYEYIKLLDTKKFLEERGVHLILVDTPKYNPNDSIMEQQKFHYLVETYLPDFDYIDYVSFPLPIECYGDITHLNHRGAEIFSRYLQENGIGEYCTEMR